MTSNREFLDNLAATDPQALQAWFDARHVDEGELLKQVNELQQQVDKLKRELEAEHALVVQFEQDNERLQRENLNLAHDLAESERLREEMREELSVAYDHAHDMLARRDRGLA